MNLPASGFSWEAFRRVPVVGILRGYDQERILRAIRAAASGGLTTVEITMDTHGGAASIAALRREFGDAMNVGAGTVTTLERLESALAAGAQFIVTPSIGIPVMERCRALDVPIFPGALSPTEVLRASEAGAALVKVFPAEGLGPRYIAALHEALPGVGLLPTGGVELGTLETFVAAGASGFGVGGPLFRKERVMAEDWAWIETQCRAWAGWFRDRASG
jgi:2-dehydro-3-deoxyphosphogluconate aldolase/(4S)-4-hydroxy-2-oxoglutarate aldolase